jgi:hypothetical protein
MLYFYYIGRVYNSSKTVFKNKFVRLLKLWDLYCVYYVYYVYYVYSTITRHIVQIS